MKKLQIASLCVAAFFASSSVVMANKPLPKITPYHAKIQVLPILIEDVASWDELDRPIDDDDENGIGGDDVIPAAELYPIWNNLYVNPYKVSIDSILTDSINIDLQNFSFPLAKHYRVTSEFGPRRYRYHYGIDLKVERGDTVKTVMDGMVRIAKKMKGYGNFVVVRHHNGMESFYGHLDKILVSPDQSVKSGELIGLGGNTGRSTGPHLHFELRYLGQPINPRDMIDFDSLCAKADSVKLSQLNFSYNKSIRTAVKGGGTSKGKVWAVKSGDSLGRISQRTGVSIARLCALNGISKNKVLKVGQRIQY